MVQVVGYCRDSGGRDQDLSIDQQVAEINAYAATHDLSISQLFVDASRSGRSTARRDQFLAMVEHLTNGAVDAGVIVWSYSRLARDFDAFQYYAAAIRQAGKSIISLTDHVPDSLDGRVMESLIAWQTAKYSHELSINIKRGLNYIANTYNAIPGARVPAGYTADKITIGAHRDGKPHQITRLVPGQDADLVRQAFEMRAEGRTLREIHEATRLHTNLSSYTWMLRNPIYTGKLERGGIQVDGICEPLIDIPTWEAVQKRYTDLHPRRQRSRYVLSGITRCMLCGSGLVGATIPKRNRITYYYYRCSGASRLEQNCHALRIRKDDLERAVMAAIRSILLDDKLLDELRIEVERQLRQDTRDAQIQRARADYASTAAAIKRITSAIEAAGHSEALLARLSALEIDLAALSALVVELESKQPAVIQLPADMGAFGVQAWQSLEGASDRDKQLILRGFIDGVMAAKIDGAIKGEITVTLFGVTKTVSL